MAPALGLASQSAPAPEATAVVAPSSDTRLTTFPVRELTATMPLD
jgi:hypothetical protein